MAISEREAVAFQGKFSVETVGREIENYVRDFVCCKECFERTRKYCLDTHLVKEGRLTFFKM